MRPEYMYHIVDISYPASGNEYTPSTDTTSISFRTRRSLNSLSAFCRSITTAAKWAMEHLGFPFPDGLVNVSVYRVCCCPMPKPHSKYCIDTGDAHSSAISFRLNCRYIFINHKSHPITYIHVTRGRVFCKRNMCTATRSRTRPINSGAFNCIHKFGHRYIYRVKVETTFPTDV